MSVCARCGYSIESSGAEPSICERCLFATALDRDTLSGESFGNYEILCKIGEGGMGFVYLAQQQYPVHREVAIKVLKPGLDTSNFLRRFESERQALALMSHANIATFHDAGTSSLGHPYFVMEFVDGCPITDACNQNSCTIPQRLAIFVKACRAIDHAHRKGIVHRDIKPSNILIAERDGELIPKVIDFGIARATAGHLTGQTVATSFGEFLGTPEFMSPEQAAFNGRAIGPASDIYSMGVLLFELVADVLPFDPVRLRTSGMSEAARIVREEPAPTPAKRLKETGQELDAARKRQIAPDELRRVLSRDLARVLHICLQKDPRLRYPSMAALADDIDRYLRGEPVLAEGPSLGYRTRKLIARYRFALGMAGPATLVAAALIWSHRPSRPVTPPTIKPLTSYTGTELQPSFSPDGKMLAFVWDGGRQNYDIYVKPVNGGEPVRITTNPAQDLFPAWSPDGRYLAFLRISPAGKELWVIPASGGQERRIVSLQTQELHWYEDVEQYGRKPGPAWALDGRSLVISDSRPGTGPDALYEYAVGDGRGRRLTQPEVASAGDFLPAFSPDGHLLAFVRNATARGNSSINVIDRRNDRERRIFSEERGVNGLAWMSDTRVLFSSNRSGPNMLWQLPAKGGTPQPVLGAGRGTQFISYSRSIESVTFAERFRNNNIWRVPLQNGKAAGAAEKFLFSSLGTEAAEFSPDGKTIVFVSNRLGTRQIWAAQANGSSSVQLSAVAPEVPIGTPRWSPDCRQIVYDTAANGRSVIALMNADGSQPHIVTNDAWDDMMPSFSHDGHWIYFACNINGTLQVCRKPASGGPTMSITREGGREARESPDGRFIYYAKGKGIWQVPRGGGAETPLPGLGEVDNGRYWTVARDAIYLLLSTQKPWRIHRYDLATGKISPVATIEKQPDFGSPSLAISPDLKSLLFGQVDQQGSNIVMVEGISPY